MENKRKKENDIADKREQNGISKVKHRGGKTRMKRAAACLLALCLVVQGPASLMTSFADFGQRHRRTAYRRVLLMPGKRVTATVRMGN